MELKSIVDRAISRHSANTFHPTDSQRKAKAAYWAHYFSTGDVAPTSPDSASAARISGYNEVVEWWSVPGFPEWFSNGEEFRQRVEYISQLGLNTLETVLTDPGVNTKERLVAARMALEIAGKFPKSTPKDLEESKAVDQMDRKQLEELLASKLKLLAPTSGNE